MEDITEETSREKKIKKFAPPPQHMRSKTKTNHVIDWKHVYSRRLHAIPLKELRHDILSHFFDGLITVKVLGNLKIMVC